MIPLIMVTFQASQLPDPDALLLLFPGSEEDVTRRRRADDDEDLVVSNLRRSESDRAMQGSYRSLLHENMSLLDKLRQQEDLCRALETQMGDIDSKMDNVANQHARTLGKLGSCSMD